MPSTPKELHMTQKHFENPASWLTTTIEQFVTQSPQNSLQNSASDKAFDKPLVGFSKGNDPLYEDYKQHVGPFHWTPMDIFNQTFPELSVSPEELTVISWILPQTAATRVDNQQQTKWPAERWARARIYGEEFNVKLRISCSHQCGHARSPSSMDLPRPGPNGMPPMLRDWEPSDCAMD
jgi:hypothetical protein